MRKNETSSFLLKLNEKHEFIHIDVLKNSVHSIAKINPQYIKYTFSIMLKKKNT